jgi:hypothetical protein
MSKLFKKRRAVQTNDATEQGLKALATNITLVKTVGYRIIWLQTVMSLLGSHRKASVEDHHLMNLHRNLIGSAGICRPGKNSRTHYTNIITTILWNDTQIYSA